jgi:serine/threonine-protein kinase|nr:serine/threonine-protein kinase [Candidatus Krumholzibacteria bacterium]
MLNEPTWSRIGALFHDALELPPEERDRFLAQECGDDTALLDEVQSMLAAHDNPTRMRVEDRLLSDGTQVDPMLGRVIGAYRLVALIGRGGMGDVYLAERDDDQFEHRVAFKLIRPGLGGRVATERFLRERQILAQLEHPNIAMLLDGGVTDDGHPYLVMQYVDGEPITAWCRERNLSLAQRLDLFRTVCDAVQAAHNNLVVHRDLKPANILVTGDGQVRLLDFGIAKLLDEAEPGPTAPPDLMLTPAHAAPEQVTGQAVTTATDVYALGVLLYEMLTEERPFAVDQSSAAAIERSICDTAPVPPSQRTTAHHRRLRGELDSIVLMALRKDPLERYQSARELGDDIAHHQQGRPVQAHGDSLVYRAGKAVRRHRWAVMAAAAFLLTVAWSLGAITQESRKRLEQRDRAVAEQAKADAVVGVLSDLLTRSDPGHLPEGGILTRDNFITMLDEAVDGLDDQPEVQARMRELMVSVHRAHSRNDEWLDTVNQLVAYHEQAGSSVLRLAALQHEQALATQAVHGRQAAEPLLRASLARHLQLLPPMSRDVGIASQDLALALIPRQPEEAAQLMERAFTIAQMNDSVDSLAIARAFNGLGNLAVARGDMDAARDSYDKALSLLEPHLGEAHPNVLVVTSNLALTLKRPQDLERAETLLRRNRKMMETVQGARTRSVARSWEALGVVLTLQGRHEEAIEAFDLAVDIQREVSGPFSVHTVNPLVKAAGVLIVDGRPAEALERFAQVRAMEAARDPRNQPDERLLPLFGHALESLALYEAGRRAEGLALMDELAPQLDQSAPAGQAWVLASLATARTTLLLAEGRIEEAVPAARQALDERLKEQAHLTQLVARNRCLLAAALAGAGEKEEARVLLKENLDEALDCGYLTPLQRDLLMEAQSALGL